MKPLNDTLELLMRHRSIRRFADTPVTEEQLEAIVGAAQMASTSSNVQAYSVIAVTDPGRKERLAALAGNQAYIRECPVFLVWCADLYRLREVTSAHMAPEASHIDTTENLIVATVDAALAAQNAAVAAESLGLGIVYIGGVRNDIAAFSEALELPELVYPVFGMCVGTPAQEPVLRPRLPLQSVLHRERYSAQETVERAAAYDETTRAYMRERSGGTSDTPWSVTMAHRLAQPARMQMKEFLQSRGFMKR
ncbi:oxygen-insensitive NADPH nitroreductase [Paenibacillus glufosinatiresistens]|uniref:oxygen-insensitive NADPH nitroreductase n=1 Tax=Paenibacillus glufosinatiresistens TaxID=3070657 RepID=UPI00286E3EA4|nr:oxygen-insensitive NADPH nitroreductase [Paenibacillus sp. YX.27]